MTRAARILADACPRPYWTDRTRPSGDADPLVGTARADLAVIGGGLTGLWTAILAKEEDPSRDVVVLEAGRIGAGASGRNGGFVSDSLTHGLAHGTAMWPDELDELVRLGRDNVEEIAAFLAREGIDADLRLCGKTVVATRPHEVEALAASFATHQEHGEDVTLLSADEVRKDVDSPTYLAGMRVRSGGGLVDPVRLLHGLAEAARRRGVRLHERSVVTGMSRRGDGVTVTLEGGVAHARQVVVATNAFPPLLRRIRAYTIPVWDHVIVTEPLSDAQLSAIGWSDNQGMTDAGNQFHYYRRTPDDRILFGGYDAIYYYGARTDAGLAQRDASHELLVNHLYDTFPMLDGLGVTHRWAGIIDTSTRFTPVFGTAYAGRLAYAVGYTGLGVASSRFGAQVALDLLARRRTERTRLAAITGRPIPFPPEPLRYPIVQVMRHQLAREDTTGKRPAMLRVLDKFGVGFNS
ncbi:MULTISPECIES: NAD(P)/FAD-dependent oxidoreductase [Mumia]|uniref:NAD(P)/FAD-dependent oxidoreductase n=1 Tax=Mumia TaxID=1546255 RepID=UPI001421A351|nr:MULTISPECIES: FAD-dependent oxidoreductase [unclassified Mumia]QMW64872.1 FAD-dependent oxidoreductase [Mumia sp. ZJ1417]